MKSFKKSLALSVLVLLIGGAAQINGMGNFKNMLPKLKAGFKASQATFKQLKIKIEPWAEKAYNFGEKAAKSKNFKKFKQNASDVSLEIADAFVRKVPKITVGLVGGAVVYSAWEKSQNTIEQKKAQVSPVDRGQNLFEALVTGGERVNLAGSEACLLAGYIEKANLNQEQLLLLMTKRLHNPEAILSELGAHGTCIVQDLVHQYPAQFEPDFIFMCLESDKELIVDVLTRYIRVHGVRTLLAKYEVAKKPRTQNIVIFKALLQHLKNKKWARK